MKVSLLLSTQRSGSHLLKDFVQSHYSGVIPTDEVLRQPDPVLMAKYPALPGRTNVPHFWPWYQREAAGGRISVMPNDRIPVFGRYLDILGRLVSPSDMLLDIKYNSIRSLSGYWETEYGSLDFAGFIAERGIPVLHLMRRNALKTHVSFELADRSDQWHRTGTSPAGETPRIHLSPAEALRQVEYLCSVANDMRARFETHPGYTEIYYEDFIAELAAAQPGPFQRTLSGFLDKIPLPAPTRAIGYRKTTPDNLADVVENWDEIVSAFQFTKFAAMVSTPPIQAAA